MWSCNGATKAWSRSEGARVVAFPEGNVALTWQLKMGVDQSPESARERYQGGRSGLGGCSKRNGVRSSSRG